MKPEQQRIAIAKARGWTHAWKGKHTGALTGYDPADGKERVLPNYTADRNAIAEACQILTFEQADDFYEWLFTIVTREEAESDNPRPLIFACVTAKAEWMAEAFLKTINLWTN